jgi:hypothetical protein
MSDALRGLYVSETVAIVMDSCSKPGVFSHLATFARFSVLWLDEWGRPPPFPPRLQRGADIRPVNMRRGC